MRLHDDIIGKEVLNAKGKILGNVKDIEIDSSTKKITFLILSKTKTKKTGFSLTNNNTRTEEKIPVEELGSIGDKIILNETLDDMIYDVY